ncbi:MAG: hypothetical protein JJ974_12385 [Phycisphaerales bacterium]|nr:hypothetical protein [Phycisphaerales bacterium]
MSTHPDTHASFSADLYTQPGMIRRSAALIGVLMGLSGTVLAQEGSDPDEQSNLPTSVSSDSGEAERAAREVERRGQQGVAVSLDLRARYIADTDFDTNIGDIQTTSYGGKLGFAIPIDESARLSLGFDLDVTDYDITPISGAVGTTAATVGAQFDTVLEYGVDAMYTRRMNAQQSFFVGGGVGIAAEGDADDAFVWNALGGFAVQSNPNFRWGLGVGVFSQIEDDVRVLPLPQVYIGFDDYWSLQSTGPGIKLNYKWSDELSMGVMAQFDGKSFRIDDDNTLVPGGAVDITGVPVSYYMDYKAGDSSRISLFTQVGVVVGGSMEIINSSGNTVVDEDIDPSVFAGVGLKIAF